MTDGENGRGRAETSSERDDAQRDAPEAAEVSTDADSGSEDGGQTDAQDGRLVAKLRREAAGHRSRLREVEQERDAAAEQVRRLQRQAVERASGLPDATVLERAGIDLSDLIAEDGLVDESGVQSAVDSIRRALGVTPAGVRVGPGGGGLDGGADHRGGGEDALTAALRPRKR